MKLIARVLSVLLAIGLVFPIGSAMAGGPPPSTSLNVNVLNTPSVRIVNPEASPVLIKDVENLEKSPFYATGSEAFTDGFDMLIMRLSPPVPIDKRLVIEGVSVHCDLEPTDSIFNAFILLIQYTPPGYIVRPYYLVGHKMGDGSSGIVGWTASQQVRLYSDGVDIGTGDPAGNSIVIYRTLTSGVSFCHATVAGYTIAK